MDDRKALMAAIIANPDEDTPRLALADWLQEHGDTHDQARAEFIRLQIEAAQLPEGGAARKVLDASAKKLEKKHFAAWIAPLLTFDKTRTVADEVGRPFLRGLYQFVLIGSPQLLHKDSQPLIADALAAIGVEELLAGTTKRIKELASCPAIRWVARFSYAGADDAALEAFATSPNFTHLSGLELGESTATDVGLKAFAKTSGMTRLTSLGIASGGGDTKPRGKYTVAGILALLHSERFPLLISLDLENDQPVKFDWKTFFADTSLKRLNCLRLRSGEPVATLAACRHLTNVREIRINSGVITDDDANTLLANSAFAKLTKLYMYGTNWGRPRLSKPVEKRLRDRFGKTVLNYAPEER